MSWDNLRMKSRKSNIYNTPSERNSKTYIWEAICARLSDQRQRICRYLMGASPERACTWDTIAHPGIISDYDLFAKEEVKIEIDPLLEPAMPLSPRPPSTSSHLSSLTAMDTELKLRGYGQKTRKVYLGPILSGTYIAIRPVYLWRLENKTTPFTERYDFVH